MAAVRRDESFEIRPKLRQPAPELGTRARRTIGLILQATGDLIMARGYGGARIDDIAQAAGASFVGRRHDALDDARSVAAGVAALVARGAPNPFLTPASS